MDVINGTAINHQLHVAGALRLTLSCITVAAEAICKLFSGDKATDSVWKTLFLDKIPEVFQQKW